MRLNMNVVRLSNILFLTTLTLLIVIVSACGVRDSELRLNARIGYSGNIYLTIQNNDSFNWVDVKVRLNYDEMDDDSGYFYTTPSIITGFYERIEIYQFKNSLGEPLLPQSELFNIEIQVNTSDNRTGSFQQEW